MEITLVPLSAANRADLDRCDTAFRVEAERVLRVEEGRITWAERPVSPWTKRYEQAHDAGDYTGREDRAAWLAYAGDRLAGQLLVAQHWNRLATVQDIAVDPPWRRMGFGRRLMARAMAWAGDRGLAGVMVETQQINVPACRFYESCGLALGGLDLHLYRGFDPGTREIALFYYRFFQGRLP